MNSLSYNRKAGGLSVIAIVVGLMTIGLLFFITAFVAKTFVTNIVAIPIINQTSPTAVTTFNGMSTTVDRFDYLFLGLFIGLILALMISSWYLGAEPVFVFLYFIIMVIAVPAAAIMANSWNDLTTTSAFGTTINSFPITNHILIYLPYYIVGIGLMGMVIIFIKPYFSRSSL